MSLHCIVGSDGSPADCRSTSEDPVGAGGAAAALSLSQAYLVNAWTPQGLPTAGAPVTLDIVFTDKVAGAPPAR